ncbi:MAG: carbohydrate kinase family protein [Candidatus Levybacteria bacterium]|nr:carbohydrate kinase family protein [Candidatus Levybacteria bacterium]
MNQKNILVTGSLAFDFIMDFPGNFTDHIHPELIHNINVSFVINQLKKEYGGTAGNIAYSLNLLKIPVSIIGTAGKDFTPYKNFLKKEGIDVSNIKIIKNEFTSQAYMITDKKDDQITAFYPGAMKFSDTLSVPSKDKPALMLITPCTSKAFKKFVFECRNLNIPYMFDPGQHITEIPDEILADGLNGAKFFIGNDYEYAMIKKRLNLKDDDFLKKAEIVIVTLGEKGSVIKTGKSSIEISSAKAKNVVDPTGAGDAYRAGLVAGYIKGYSLKTCGQMGATLAAYAIEKYGTQKHRFTIKEFNKRYEENFGILKWLK